MNIRPLLPILLAAATAAGDPDHRWLVPEEVISAKGEREPIPVDVARTRSGATGVFVFEKDAGLTLHVSKDGRPPWKVLMLPLGLPGGTRTEEAVAETLLTDMDARTVAFARFDLEKAEELSRTPFPGKTTGTPLFSRLEADGATRSALVVCEGGDVNFSSSSDAGATWTAPTRIARNARHDDSICPPLYRTSRGLSVLHVDEAGAPAAIESADGGKTWATSRSAPALAEKDGKPILVAGAADGRDLHAVFLTSEGRYVHVLSGDEGAHWQKPVLLAVTRLCDTACFFDLRAARGTVTFAWSEPGKGDRHVRRARLLVSRNAGNSWEESPIAGGLAADSGWPVVRLTPEAGVFALLSARPEEGKGGGKFVLLRESQGIDAPAPVWPAGRRVPEWWKGE